MTPQGEERVMPVSGYTGLSNLLFDLIRRMDAEADTVKDGHASGLNWYGAHAQPGRDRPRTEVSWSARLAELLRAEGLEVECEVRYPDTGTPGRQRCDLVATFAGGKRIWIEVKGAWKHYWLQQGSAAIYRSYLLYPLDADLPPKSHTAAQDVAKLQGLHPPEADFVGLLLLGFDSKDAPMDKDVAELEALAQLGRAPWTSAHDDWNDPRRPGQRVQCWFWARPAEA